MSWTKFTGLLRGRIALGLVAGAAVEEFDVVSLLADFHAAHPQVAISLTEDTSVRLLDALGRGGLDIAVAGLTGEEPPPGVSLQVVTDDPLVAAVALGDPLLTPC